MSEQKIRTWAPADSKTADAWLAPGRRVVVRHTMPQSRWTDVCGRVVRILEKGSKYSEEEFAKLPSKGDYAAYAARPGGFACEGVLLLMDNPRHPESPYAVFFRDDTFTVSPLEDIQEAGPTASV